MAFENYWRKVGKLSPHIGTLYIGSKIVFGIGIGLLIASAFGFSWCTGAIVTIVGILLMIPAERYILK